MYCLCIAILWASSFQFLHVLVASSQTTKILCLQGRNYHEASEALASLLFLTNNTGTYVHAFISYKEWACCVPASSVQIS